MPQRQFQLSELPTQLVFCVISKHFTATLHIPLTSTGLKDNSINGNSTVEPQAFTTDYYPAYAPFKQINPDNACILRITAAAGTELADAYSYGTVRLRHVGVVRPV